MKCVLRLEILTELRLRLDDGYTVRTATEAHDVSSRERSAFGSKLARAIYFSCALAAHADVAALSSIAVRGGAQRLNVPALTLYCKR